MNLEVNNMDFESILDKALGIAKDKKFIVHIFNGKDITVETKELSYLQLGTFLITNAEGIKEIRIYTN